MTQRAATLNRPMPWLMSAAILSAAGIGVAAATDAPIWVLGIVGLAPWLPLLGMAVLATMRAAGGWMALYLGLALTQAGHVGEHVVQVIQLRVLGLSGEHAHGVFGALDIEWVHFAWNSWIMVAVAILLVRFHRNPWLWATALLAAWHLLEHAVLIVIYLATGVQGTPGLLARGGLVVGGLDIARPELHLVYNLAETLPLLIGLGWELRRRTWRYGGELSRTT
jgi:hypothetical protein